MRSIGFSLYFSWSVIVLSGPLVYGGEQITGVAVRGLSKNQKIKEGISKISHVVFGVE